MTFTSTNHDSAPSRNQMVIFWPENPSSLWNHESLLEVFQIMSVLNMIQTQGIHTRLTYKRSFRDLVSRPATQNTHTSSSRGRREYLIEWHVVLNDSIRPLDSISLYIPRETRKADQWRFPGYATQSILLNGWTVFLNNWLEEIR